MIKIVTDSTGGIPENYANENDIKIVPLKVLVGEKEYEENFNDLKLDMYTEVAKTKQYPKTSQPSYEKFLQYFNDLTLNGDQVLCLTMAASLSGTFSCANLARQSCNNPDKVFVVDSGSAVHTIYGLIEEVCKMIKLNFSVESILKKIEQLKENSGVAFIPDTLGYLQKGGRIGKVQAILGTVLNIKPIILFRHAEVTNPKKSLGLTRAIADLVEMISGKVKKLFIIQVGNSPFFQKMKDAVLAKFANVAFEDGYVGPVVGAHVGPSIGVAWISE